MGGLIERYTEIAPEVELIAYVDGYKGLLLGQSVTITPEVRAKAALLHRYGGSPIGNSRVKLTNVKDCVKRGLVKEGQDPQKVAADPGFEPIALPVSRAHLAAEGLSPTFIDYMNNWPGFVAQEQKEDDL